MKRLVGFGLPRRLSLEERHYIGKCSLKSAFVVKRNPAKIAASIKNYFLEHNAIIFEIVVHDPHLEEIMDSGDPAPEYEWLDPIASMISPLT
jgi:hypothetical protein